MSRVDAAGISDGLSLPVRALLRQAEETPDRTVLVTRQERWSSRRLVEQAYRVAVRDVKPGGRVALHMRNTVVLAFFTGFLISDGYSGYRQLLPRLAGVQ